MNNPVRRNFIIDPADGLLLTPNGFEAWENNLTFCRETGLEPQDLAASTLCSAPIPRYFPQFNSPRRFSQVNPRDLWHPFFWLPKHLAQKASLTLPSGEPYMESWDAYALRIVFEMGSSGVFSQDGWLDVLSTVGINVDNPAHIERIERWQQGGADPALDSIDLTELFVAPSNPLWSLELARILEETAVHGQQHLMALAFKEALASTTADEALDMYRHIGQLAGIYLRSAQFPEGLSGEVFWDRIVDETRNPHFKDNGEQFLKYRGAITFNWLDSLISSTEGNVEHLHMILKDDEED